ncbi:WAT1-related protein [Quillaja saponaria]|uniref:WAT1-related protein n=1 Tax=Quillaja saponaria TaxID=32244 RepID=A0AAD7LA93_QUISA|nr:WAT1-related protein [Quillaja saponaria]
MQGLGVTTAMVTAQFLEVGLNTIIKAATTNGMSNFVFIVYSNAFALLFLLPSTFMFHRKRAPPQITFAIIWKIFILGLLSCSVQILMYTGIGYSSPTLASAMLDLSPAFTFILAIISRMEKLELKTHSTQAKVAGTVVSITGALILTLYKGLPIKSGTGSLRNNIVLDGDILSWKSDWVIGGIFLAAGSFCLSVLLVVQTWIIRDYPAEMMVTSICCFFVTVQSAIVGVIAEKKSKAWILRADKELIAIVYSAIFVVSVRSIVHAWACRMKGPVYVAMFNPLGMVIALVMGILFLGDTLYLGSVIGGVIIAIGFYVVIWGKAQEEVKMVSDESGGEFIFESSSSTAPLLQNKNVVGCFT